MEIILRFAAQSPDSEAVIKHGLSCLTAVLDCDPEIDVSRLWNEELSDFLVRCFDPNDFLSRFRPEMMDLASALSSRDRVISEFFLIEHSLLECLSERLPNPMAARGVQRICFSTPMEKVGRIVELLNWLLCQPDQLLHREALRGFVGLLLQFPEEVDVSVLGEKMIEFLEDSMDTMRVNQVLTVVYLLPPTPDLFGPVVALLADTVDVSTHRLGAVVLTRFAEEWQSLMTIEHLVHILEVAENEEFETAAEAAYCIAMYPRPGSDDEFDRRVLALLARFLGDAEAGPVVLMAALQTLTVHVQERGAVAGLGEGLKALLPALFELRESTETSQQVRAQCEAALELIGVSL
jgi:hypothetical protein